jgi:5-methylthioadenosine/S-adenosylhomocysteine deaminase
MADSSHAVDTLIDARWVIPVEPPGAVLERHTVAIANGSIAAVTPTDEAHRRYAGARRISLPDHALIPGLINLHTHAAMTLMRGLADDIALMDWLRTHVWPVEARMATKDFVRDGTLLACAEMLRGGITCFNEMYFFPEAAAHAALQSRMRAAIGIITFEMPSLYASDAADYLAKGLATRDALREEPLLSFCLAPHAPYTVSDATFRQVAVYAAELDLPIHIHLHETLDEIRESIAACGKRPLQRLRELGLLGPSLIGVHAVHLEDDEIALLAEHECSVAHCPTSNLKLASGIAPVAKLLEHKVNVGLGTDGAASNNRLDLFAEMRLAALLAKGTTGDTTVVPAHTALAMATLHGARALGLDRKTGSLVAGKRADITAVNLGAPELSPCYDPVSHLVYAAGREHVSHVWVDGELLVEEGRLLHVDTLDLTRKAAYWKDKIRSPE